MISTLIMESEFMDGFKPTRMLLSAFNVSLKVIVLISKLMTIGL